MTVSLLAAVRRFALICHHDDAKPGIEVTYWPSSAEARQALAELTPCGPLCVGAHTVVDIDPPPHHPATLGLSRNLHAHNASQVVIVDPRDELIAGSRRNVN